MKRIVLAIILFLSLTNLVIAQSADKIAVSLGVDAVFPFHELTGGPGVSVKAEFPLAPHLALTVTGGYLVNYLGTRYATPDITANYPGYVAPVYDNEPYKFIPLKAGLRYFYAEHFYVEGDAGEAFSLNNQSSNSFIFEGALGTVINFNPHNGLDLSIGCQRYKIADYDPFGEFAFRIAYRFKFRFRKRPSNSQIL